MEILTLYAQFFARMKPSMDLYLDTFDPVFATTPQGVFCKQEWDYTAEVKGRRPFL